MDAWSIHYHHFIINNIQVSKINSCRDSSTSEKTPSCYWEQQQTWGPLPELHWTLDRLMIKAILERFLSKSIMLSIRETSEISLHCSNGLQCIKSLPFGTASSFQSNIPTKTRRAQVVAQTESQVFAWSQRSGN